MCEDRFWKIQFPSRQLIINEIFVLRHDLELQTRNSVILHNPLNHCCHVFTFACPFTAAFGESTPNDKGDAYRVQGEPAGDVFLY